jgi:ABC-type protease/lipase transport system fused ATPase/permease subunit
MTLLAGALAGSISLGMLWFAFYLLVVHDQTVSDGVYDTRVALALNAGALVGALLGLFGVVDAARVLAAWF